MNWILVSDRLPKERKLVLVKYTNSCREDNYAVAALEKGKWYTGATKWLSPTYDEVTQWTEIDPSTPQPAPSGAVTFTFYPTLSSGGRPLYLASDHNRDMSGLYFPAATVERLVAALKEIKEIAIASPELFPDHPIVTLAQNALAELDGAK